MILLIDHLAQRYGRLPSEMLGMPMNSGKAILFDMATAQVSMEEKAMTAGTLQGNIKSSRARWPSNIKDEIRRQQRVG